MRPAPCGEHDNSRTGILPGLNEGQIFVDQDMPDSLAVQDLLQTAFGPGSLRSHAHRLDEGDEFFLPQPPGESDAPDVQIDEDFDEGADRYPFLVSVLRRLTVDEELPLRLAERGSVGSKKYLEIEGSDLGT